MLKDLKTKTTCSSFSFACILILIENPDEWQVDHIDRNSMNNKLENLRWADISLNANNKTFPETNKRLRKAVNHYDEDGNFIHAYGDVHIASKEIGISVYAVRASAYSKGLSMTRDKHRLVYVCDDENLQDYVIDESVTNTTKKKCFMEKSNLFE